MKINEIIVENQKLDEISGKAIGAGLGALAGGLLGGPLGAAAGGAAGAGIASWFGKKMDPDAPANSSAIIDTVVKNSVAEWETLSQQLKSSGSPPTVDDVVGWARQKFAKTNAPGTSKKMEFITKPRDVSLDAVESWLRKEIADNIRTGLTAPAPSAPEPDLAIAAPVPPVPADGSSLNTNRGVYKVTGGKWVDSAAKPVTPELSDRLSQLYDESNKITGVAGFPGKSVSINTSRGEFIYTNALGAWNWYQAPVTSRSQPPITDRAVIQRLNEIAKEQATP